MAAVPIEDDADQQWMRRAIDLSKLSVTEPERLKPPPSVGVVIVKAGQLLGEGYRGKSGDGEHAEYGVLKDLGFPRLEGAVVYTTLEPCSKRGEGKTPCAERLADARPAVVWIANYDHNPDVYRIGWRILRNADIVVRDFPQKLRIEAREVSAAFHEQWRTVEADSGSASFDFTQNDGLFRISTRGGVFDTYWTRASGTSIHAMQDRYLVADCRYATMFSDIHDPTAYDWVRVVTVDVNGLTMFKNDSGWFLVVRVIDVQAIGYKNFLHRQSTTNRVTIEWEIRRVP
jgi:diaminohydroxyphosphoribosylaminopyrimidine deaminase/5-amino-6-(5-phosphoribosylamino)uracil reductase